MSQTISPLTDAMVAIPSENVSPVTWVNVDEVESGDCGIGRHARAAESVELLAARKAPVAAR